MIDATSLLIGLFLGLGAGSMLGAMVMFLFVLYTRANFANAEDDVSTDDEI